MKLLSFNRLVGLAVIGGVAYVHKQRGGEWTVASVTDTLKDLWSSALGKLEAVQAKTSDVLDRASTTAKAAVRDLGADEDNLRPYGGQTGRH